MGRYVHVKEGRRQCGVCTPGIRDTIVPYSFNTAITTESNYQSSYLCARVLQIRQEKPYYIADPEVDSLVSISLFARCPRDRKSSRLFPPIFHH